jgi:hypothetical protein
MLYRTASEAGKELCWCGVWAGYIKTMLILLAASRERNGKMTLTVNPALIARLKLLARTADTTKVMAEIGALALGPGETVPAEAGADGRKTPERVAFEEREKAFDDRLQEMEANLIDEAVVEAYENLVRREEQAARERQAALEAAVDRTGMFRLDAFAMLAAVLLVLFAEYPSVVIGVLGSALGAKLLWSKLLSPLARRKAAAPRFIVGISEDSLAHKRIVQQFIDTDRRFAALGVRPELVVFPDGVEGFNARISAGVNGVYLDKSVLDEAASGPAEFARMAAPIAADASAVLISSKTRDELAKILDEIRKTLDALAPADIDRDMRMALERKLASGIDAARSMVDLRRRELSGVYNAGIARAVNEARDKRFVTVTTEKVAVSDPYVFENMEKAAAAGITSYIAIGKIFKDAQEAAAFVKASGYRGDMSAIRFVAQGGSCEDIVGAVMAQDPGVKASNVGIRAAEGELRKRSVAGILLEVPTVKSGGDEICIALNSYQTLLRILAGYSRGLFTAEEMNIPGVKDGEIRGIGIFRYLPPVTPQDYNEEIRTYRDAMMLIRRAA